MGFEICLDERIFGKDDRGRIFIKLSTDKQYNALSFDEDGNLVLTPGKDGHNGVGGGMNIPGNGIAGNVGEGMELIRCNSTVTRLETNDPHQEDGGKSIKDIIKHILGRDDI